MNINYTKKVIRPNHREGPEIYVSGTGIPWGYNNRHSHILRDTSLCILSHTRRFILLYAASKRDRWRVKKMAH